MDIGLCIFATDYAIRIDELARAAEDRGYESLFVPEHTHIPTSRRTPFPGGGELPREYSHTYDPFVSLMAAAAATRRLKVGTGICLIIERDTIVTAKEVASLDALSDGRFHLRLGLADAGGERLLHWLDDALVFLVYPAGEERGVVRLEGSWAAEKNSVER